MEHTLREFHDKIDLTCSPNQSEMLHRSLAVHPFVHCLEIITTNPNPPEFPQSPAEMYHVLLDYRAFRDDRVVDDLFNPTTRFVSLSPIDTGNGMFVQRGAITLLLNDATYKRFGLTGRKYGVSHIVTIVSTNRDWLRRAQPFQAIEGLLISENVSVYEDYVKKSAPFENQIDMWTPTKPLEFDIAKLGTDDWKAELLGAVERNLCTREEIPASSNTFRLTVQGLLDGPTLEAYLTEVGKEGYSIAMIWDMDDVPASYVGKSGTMQGCGGGCEMVLFGKDVPQAVRYQTCLFRNEE